MAQLKDLIVNGASRFIGDVFTNKIQVTTISAPTTAGGSTYGTGSNGQALMTNGTSTYWGEVSTTSVFARGTGEDSIVAINSTNNNTASGEKAVAIGNHNTSSGDVSFTIGSSNIASGIGSFAGGTKSENVSSGNVASGYSSFAFGLSTTASGNYSIAMGLRTEANGIISTAIGNYTIATGRASTVLGQYNIEDTVDNANTATYGAGAKQYLFIIGNGSSTTRSNAMTVDWEGNGVFSNSVSAGNNEINSYSIIAAGTDNVINSRESLMVGNENISTSAYHSIIVGDENIVNINSGITVGGSNIVDGACSIVNGSRNIVSTSGYNALILGLGLVVSGRRSVTVGLYCKNDGPYNICIGNCSYTNTTSYGIAIGASAPGTTLTISGTANATTYTYTGSLPDVLINFSDRTFNIIDDTVKKSIATILSIDTNNNTITVDRTLSDEAISNRECTIVAPTASLHAYSAAIGSGVLTTRAKSLVIGSVNALDPDGLFIVGNGSSSEGANNAFVVHLDGTGLFESTVSAGTITAPAAVVNPNDLATKQYVDNSFAANDAMTFKGTIGTGGTTATLPTTHAIGDTYRVTTTGTYAGLNCEVGDLIICIADGTAANNTDWTVALTNVDGAVFRGSTGFTNNYVLVATGTNGLVRSVTATLGIANGTSAGPTIQLKLNNSVVSSVAIPVANTGLSGVVTNDILTFAGAKTFNGVTTFSNSAVFLKSIIGTSGQNYGASLPTSAVNGQLFFLINNGGYELPDGGTAGYALIKNSGNDRDVKWSNLNDLYVRKTGDTMTGNLVLEKTTTLATNDPATLLFIVNQSDNNASYTGAYIKVYDDGDDANNGVNMLIRCGGNMIIGSGEGPSNFYNTAVHGITASNGMSAGSNGCVISETGENTAIVSDNGILLITGAGTIDNRCLTFLNSSGYLYTVRTYGAVWNDYAEYRESDILEPGRVIKENGDDTLSLTTKRLERGCEIVSDTFGFAIGETEKAKTPTAASGRVLAYPYESYEEFKTHIGWPVCSGPGGTVSIMTEEEEEKYPSRIIGTISAVPDYDIWYSGGGKEEIQVNGRVWIRVR